ncbi:MAG TPA: hypothetical protein VEZ47_04345 [Gemmatirosa sp.]|nr:hypothetical protein [Gemmatirosa sp.]
MNGAHRAPAGAFSPAALSAEVMTGYLARQRWSGARAAPPTAVRVETVLALDAPAFAAAAPAALALVHATVGGQPVRYQLPLVSRPSAGLADGVTDGMTDVVSRIEQPPAAVLDATLDPAFRLGLLDALARGVTIASGPLRWHAAPLDAEGAALLAAVRDQLGAAAAPAHGSRVLGAEQSNTSLVFGDAVIVKLFRRLEPGDHPDVEIGRVLARRGFAHVPRLLGTCVVEDAGGTSVAAMAQQVVPGAADAWAHAVAQAMACTLAADEDDARAAAAAHAAEAARLGRVTRALHDALAAAGQEPELHEAFGARAAGASDVARWATAARRSLAGALDAAAAAGTAMAASSTGDGAHALREFVARRAAIDQAIAAAAAAVGDDAGAMIRHHGDYHLGQVLRGADGALFVIDFEGEPARPLAERRARHAPLRDVAGMLRSYGYAAATAARAVAEASAGAEPPQAARLAHWEAEARAGFLAGYLDADFDASGLEGADRPPRTAGVPAGVHGAAYLPRARVAVDALVRLFELEKLSYEVRYELENRPSWLAIPVTGLARLLDHPALDRAGAAVGAHTDTA